MQLLRFESDAPETPEPLIQSLTRTRDRFVETQSVDFDDDANRCARLPDRLPFFALPEQQLHAYEKHRESSELGHIFRIANGLHDHIDALVVLGDCGGFVAAQGLAEACCDPFHNELSRALRGSKPRIYFARPDWDNDQIHSLRQRMAAGGYGDTPGENHWAMICIDGERHGEAIENVDIAGKPLSLGQSSLGQSSLGQSSLGQSPVGQYLLDLVEKPREAVPELVRDSIVTSIGRFGDGSHDDHLRIPSSLMDAQRVFTPAVLLPAAFLGFDCIQLLVGAAAMNKAFGRQPFESNPVLRYVAATMDQREALGWWPRSLAGFDRWIRRLRVENKGGAVRCTELLPLDTATADVDRVLADSGNVTCTHICSDTIRTDPITVPSPSPSVWGAEDLISTTMDSGSLNQTLQHGVDDRYRQTQDCLRENGVRQNTISLPAVDTHSLGQLLQFFLLAQAVRDRLGA